MSGDDLEELDAALIVMIASAETIHNRGRRDLSSDEAKEALHHLALLCSDLIDPEHGLGAAVHIESMTAVRRRVLAAIQAAKNERRNAALIAAGWTPPPGDDR